MPASWLYTRKPNATQPYTNAPLTAHAAIYASGNMTIQYPDTYLANLWDWACLAGTMPGKMTASDIDGIIERRGKFLVIETKSPGVPVPTGQRILLDALADNGAFTVIVVHGQPGKPEQLTVTTSVNGERVMREYNPATLETLRDIVKRWFAWVDKTANWHNIRN